MTQEQFTEKRKKRPVADLSTMVYGKVPPQAREAEEAVLGAILLEKSAFDVVSEVLHPEMFYVDAHSIIYTACMSLVKKSIPIDIILVTEELLKSGELDLIGGPYYLTKLTNSVITSAHIDMHSRIVYEKYVLREIIRVSGEMISKAYDDSTDVFDLQDDLETEVFAITNSNVKEGYKQASTVGAQVINRIDELRNSDVAISGVTSGFPSLDRITYGWQKTDLIILAARPAVGKTAFALNLARNAALNTVRPTPVAFFSLEMSAPQLVQRMISADSEVYMEKISRGKMDDYDYRRVCSSVMGMGSTIFIDDSASLNIFQLRAKARRMVSKDQVGFIIIDYLQLMSGGGKTGGNREQEISAISRGLKQLAKELQVPIIALSQLSRAVETRKESKVPQLSDLRESGAIEQDADMVMFIYRPEYYEQMNNEHGESTKGETHIKIAKHRNGSLDTIRLHANLAIQKFTEMDDPQIPVQPTNNWKKINPGSFDDGFKDDEPF